MAKKSFGLVMLVAVLAFGMAVTGCSNDDTNVSPIDGRWVAAGASAIVMVFENGNFRTYYDGVLLGSGTFTTSGNNVTVTQDGETETATFSVSGNTLTITFTVDGETFTQVYHRQ